MSARSSKSSEHRDRDLFVRLKPIKAALLSRATDGELVDRIRSEFVEMQGFSPTLQQAVRLFHLAEMECLDVLVALVQEGFLEVSQDGRYRLRRRG